LIGGGRAMLCGGRRKAHQSGWSHIHRIIVIPTHSGTETTIARTTITAIHRNSSVVSSKTDPSFVRPSISRCAAIPSLSPSKNPSIAPINLMQFCPVAIEFPVFKKCIVVWTAQNTKPSAFHQLRTFLFTSKYPARAPVHRLFEDRFSG
jgi:hypothetical protein